MKDMNQLKDLLKHEIQDLCSAEDQIIEALPKMFEKASDPRLKQALKDHLEITEVQRDRLDQVLDLLNERGNDEDQDEKGIIGLFRGNGKQNCKGMKGLIEEGQSVMKEDMSSDVMDAAIIAAAQKIEHYEICAYGTTSAFAEELNLSKVEKLLRQTLDEEYEADDLLTDMAVGRLNREAVNGRRSNGRSGNRNGKQSSGTRRSTTSGPKSESRSTRKVAARTSGSRSGSRAASSSSRSKSTQSTKKKTRSSSR